jgi:hypothetical protein
MEYFVVLSTGLGARNPYVSRLDNLEQSTITEYVENIKTAKTIFKAPPST